MKPGEEEVRLTLHVQPRASRTELAGRHGDALKVRVAAPPVDGAANAELVRFLAELLGVAKSAVEIVAGESGRRKVVAVHGVGLEAARRVLGVEGVGGQ
jgi:uncharacterized protein (TIGR00251 family)